MKFQGFEKIQKRGGQLLMENRGLLIALVICFVCLWLEQVTREKKETLDKFIILGLSMSIIGIVIVLISSFFV